MDILKHKFHPSSVRERRIEELQKTDWSPPRVRNTIRPETEAWIKQRRAESSRMGKCVKTPSAKFISWPPL